MVRHNSHRSESVSWTPRDVWDKAVAYHSPSLEHRSSFWSYGSPRNRFDKLSQYLHVNNNENQVPRENPAHDKLFKVRPVLDRVVECCKMELRPDKN